MISTPKCHLSKQVANKVCIHNKCIHPAFICKHCQKDDCQQLHYHDQNKLQVVRWTQITQLTQKIEESANGNKWFLQTMIKLQKQVNKLIDEVNSIIQIYSKRVQQFDKDREMDPQFKRVWDNLKEKKWDLIKGKQIRILYDRLKEDNFIMNKEVIREMKEKESKNVNLLLDGIQQKLIEYIKNDIVIIPQSYQQQLKKYNQQIKLNPRNSYAYDDRGWLYYNRNQLDKALSDYNNAIECDPKNQYSYNRRGILYKNRNQLDKALSDYNKAIECDPKNTYAYNNRGNVHKNRNQLQKALSDFNTAIECDRKNSDAYCNRGSLYYNRNQLDKALSDYNKAIECYPQNSDAYYNRALLYDNRNQLDKALSDYNKAIECNPKNSDAYCNRGSLYYNRNQLEKALTNYTKAIECIQKSIYYRNRALVYRQLNMIKQAESDQKKSDQLNR